MVRDFAERGVRVAAAGGAAEAEGEDEAADADAVDDKARAAGGIATGGREAEAAAEATEGDETAACTRGLEEATDLAAAAGAATNFGGAAEDEAESDAAEAEAGALAFVAIAALRASCIRRSALQISSHVGRSAGVGAVPRRYRPTRDWYTRERVNESDNAAVDAAADASVMVVQAFAAACSTSAGLLRCTLLPHAFSSRSA